MYCQQCTGLHLEIAYVLLNQRLNFHCGGFGESFGTVQLGYRMHHVLLCGPPGLSTTGNMIVYNIFLYIYYI